MEFFKAGHLCFTAKAIAVLSAIFLPAMMQGFLVLGEPQQMAASCNNQLQHRLLFQKINKVANELNKLQVNSANFQDQVEEKLSSMQQQTAGSSDAGNNPVAGGDSSQTLPQELIANLTASQTSLTESINAIQSNWSLSILTRAGQAITANMSQDNQQLVAAELRKYLVRDVLLPRVVQALGYDISVEGRFFKLHEDLATAAEAAASCASESGRLVHTYGDFGLELMQAFLFKDTWVAGKRVGQTMQFDFGDGIVLDAENRTPPGYEFKQNWANNQTSSAQQGIQDCILFDSAFGLWSLRACDGKFRFFCEMVVTVA